MNIQFGDIFRIQYREKGQQKVLESSYQELGNRNHGLLLEVREALRENGIKSLHRNFEEVKWQMDTDGYHIITNGPNHNTADKFGEIWDKYFPEAEVERDVDDLVRQTQLNGSTRDIDEVNKRYQNRLNETAQLLKSQPVKELVIEYEKQGDTIELTNKDEIVQQVLDTQA